MDIFEDMREEIEGSEELLTAQAIHDFTIGVYRLMADRVPKTTKADLARSLGTSPAYVTKMLGGDANFTIKSMVRIAHALGAEVRIEVAPLTVQVEKAEWKEPVKPKKAASVYQLQDYKKMPIPVGASNAKTCAAA
jgi:plasmid maintenance system antidote protein VapI